MATPATCTPVLPYALFPGAPSYYVIPCISTLRIRGSGIATLWFPNLAPQGGHTPDRWGYLGVTRGAGALASPYTPRFLQFALKLYF